MVFQLLSYNIAVVHSQQSGSCSVSECNCPQLHLNNVQNLVQSIVNETIQSVQQVLNATIDERIAQNRQDAMVNTPGIHVIIVVCTLIK